MKIAYIADDGTKFNNEDDCLHYEWCVNHPNLKDVLLLDENEEVLLDQYSLETYTLTEKIIGKTQEGANDLMALGKYTGHCYYQQVNSPGIWIFSEKDNGYIKVLDN